MAESFGNTSDPKEVKVALRAEEISARIMQNVLHQGRTISELAKHLNVSEATVLQIQSGIRPLTFEEIQSLAELAGVAFPLLLLKNFDSEAWSPQMRQILRATLEILDGKMRHIGAEKHT